jgi:hypothetical protein
VFILCRLLCFFVCCFTFSTADMYDAFLKADDCGFNVRFSFDPV